MKPTKLTVHKHTELVNAPERINKYIRKTMTLPNPEYQEAVKQGRWTGNLKEHLVFCWNTSSGVAFPRGWTRSLLNLLGQNNIKPEVNDQRRTLDPIELDFRGTLREYQLAALIDVRKRDFGVLEAATASGKTVTALAAIVERKQPTLILVHTKELLYQWAEKIREFLGIDPGLIGDGKFNIHSVTVAIVNTAKKHLDELPEHFGHLVVDECHRVPSSIFIDVVTAFDCRYMLGLSATTYRRDGLTKLIYLTLGDKIHKVDKHELERAGSVLSPRIIQRKTDFTYCYRDDYQTMLKTLIENKRRNTQIVNDIVKQVSQRPGTALVVSDRVAHCDILTAMLKEYGLRIRKLSGETAQKQREQIVSEVNDQKLDVLVSTVQLLGEGFDCPGLSSLFLTTPIKFKGRLVQVIGRILRPSDGKQPIVFDYVDKQVEVLLASAKTRSRAFKNM